MQYPTGYEVAGYVLRLLKALYGLKQLLCVWYTYLCEHLKVIELMISPYNPSVFINKGLMVNIIVAAYVNDLLVCGSSMDLVDCILKHLQSEFEMTDLEEVVNYCHGAKSHAQKPCQGTNITLSRRQRTNQNRLKLSVASHTHSALTTLEGLKCLYKDTSHFLFT